MTTNKQTKKISLVERLAVLIILIAALVIAVPRITLVSERSKIKNVKSDFNSIITALNLYKIDNETYPLSRHGGIEALFNKPAGENPANTAWNGPYLSKKTVDSWGNPYRYKCPGVYNVKSFDLYSLGKDGIEGTNDDIGNWEEGGYSRR